MIFSYLFRTCFVHFSFVFRIYAIISCPYRLSFVCFSYVFRMCFVLLYIIWYSLRIFKVSFRMFSFYKTTRRGLEFKERRALNSLRCARSSLQQEEMNQDIREDRRRWRGTTVQVCDDYIQEYMAHCSFRARK